MSIPFGTKIQSHIFKHLNASKDCRDKCDISCCKILNHANIYCSQLKILNESSHIEKLKPDIARNRGHRNGARARFLRNMAAKRSKEMYGRNKTK